MDWWGLDRELFRALHLGYKAPWLDPVMLFISFTGVGIVHAGALLCVALRDLRSYFIGALLLISVAVYYVGFKTGDSWVELGVFALLLAIFWRLERRTCIEGIAAFLLSGGIHLILKAVSQRDRPSNFLWSGPMESVYTTHSFPSGHATTAVAIGVIFLFSLENRALGWFALLWAALVCLSRVYVGVHWPSDVLAAAGLGASVAAAIKLYSLKKWPVLVSEYN
ncbi:MAG: phosphatase PAP2 family protein [Chthonomonas sp.]|nr:phosphatase PAP2 family protein [Chthonomonas sp.]